MSHATTNAPQASTPGGPRRQSRGHAAVRALAAWLALVAALVAFGGCATQVQAPDPNAAARAEVLKRYDVTENIFVPMRDGALLHGQVLRPRQAAGRLPTILLRTPYEAWATEINGPPTGTPVKALVDAGYAVVVLNERGRYHSTGRYPHTIPRPVEDGTDSIDWIVAQPWSDGRVGLFGCSSSAENQMALLAAGHPALKAAVPMSAAIAMTEAKSTGVLEPGQSRRGGVFWLSWAPWFFSYGSLDWPRHPEFDTLEQRAAYARAFSITAREHDTSGWPETAKGWPQIDALKRMGAPRTEFEDYVRRTLDDPLWRKGRVGPGDVISTPVLWMSSWFDYTPALEIGVFEDQRRVAEQAGDTHRHKLVVSSGLHCSQGEEARDHVIGKRPVGDARLDLAARVVEFFDAHLRGAAAAQAAWRARPAVEAYDNGARTWRRFERWPAAAAHNAVLRLRADAAGGRGGALTSEPDQAPGVAIIRADPSNPVPSAGGGGWPGDLGDQYDIGSVDQRAVEARADVLTFTSGVLERPLTVAGNVAVTLKVSASTPDTDIFAKLVEVAPDGTAWNVADTALRLRHRARGAPSLLQPGVRYVVELPAMVAVHTFARGSRIRLQLAPHNWPMFTLNANVAEVPELATRAQPSELNVHLDGDSLLSLPWHGHVGGGRLPTK